MTSVTSSNVTVRSAGKARAELCEARDGSREGRLAQVARCLLDGLRQREILLENSDQREQPLRAHFASLYLRFGIDSRDRLRHPRILLALAIHAACPYLCRSCGRESRALTRDPSEHPGRIFGSDGTRRPRSLTLTIVLPAVLFSAVWKRENS